MEKVTLSLPRKVVDEARSFSQESGRTLSGFFRICVERELRKQREVEGHE